MCVCVPAVRHVRRMPVDIRAHVRWYSTLLKHKMLSNQNFGYMLKGNPPLQLTNLNSSFFKDLENCFILGSETFSLFATSVLNDRKIRHLHSAFQIIRFYCRNRKLILKINFHDGLLSFKLTTAGQPAQCGQIGRHCLACISKGHRWNSKFFLPLAICI